MRLRKKPRAVSTKSMPHPSPTISEYITRKEIIDSKLRTAGWKISRFDPDRPLTAYDRCAIEEFPTESGTGRLRLVRRGEQINNLLP